MQFYKEITNKKELEEIIKYNLKQTTKIKKEIKALTKQNPPIIKKDDKNIIEEKVGIEIVLDEAEDKEEYSYYYYNIIEDLKKCKTLEEKKKCIYNDLPTFDNKNYSSIVKRIIAEFNIEINAYEEMKEEKELASAATKQINEINNIIDIIKSHIDTLDEKAIEKEEEKHNKVIFFNRLSSNKPYVVDDITNLPIEYYDDFKELLESIEYKTFKNVKQFSTNDPILKGISEVRYFKTRLVFERINSDTYALIKAFVKKSNCDNGYLEQLKIRVDKYKKNKELLLSTINEEELENHQMIYRELINTISPKNNSKVKK